MQGLKLQPGRMPLTHHALYTLDTRLKLADGEKECAVSLCVHIMFRQWSSEVRGMEGQQRVGVVTLATADLQQELGQALGAALDAVMTHLAREACQRCQVVLDSCHTLTKYYAFFIHYPSPHQGWLLLVTSSALFTLAGCPSICLNMHVLMYTPNKLPFNITAKAA